MSRHPVEVRSRALSALARGKSAEEVAQVLGVNVTSVRKWRRLAKVGNTEPGK